MERLLNLIEVNNVLNHYIPLIKKREPKKYLISVIIPVMGRIEFLKPLIESLKKAIKKSNSKINITIVEHSDNELFRIPCKQLNINYHWIKKDKKTPFNKSLCHNIGAILNKQSENFLFHDLDCLVYDNFFNNIINTLNDNVIALQTFKDRRLLYLSDEITKDIIDKKIDLNDIDINKLRVGDTGAPGGSICINKQTFIDIGGFDPELFFGYSPEDLFFWKKIEVLTEIKSVDNEVLHMAHETLQETNDLIDYMIQYSDEFNKLDRDSKLEFINNKKNTLNKFFI